MEIIRTVFYICLLINKTVKNCVIICLYNITVSTTKKFMNSKIHIDNNT